MRINVELDSPIFKEPQRRQAFSNFARRQAKDFKNLTKRRMLQSKPTGRLYKRRRGPGFTRSHQASAYGQRPAIDTGKLLNSIKDRRLDEFSAEAYAGAEYAKHLQSEGLNRPIMSDSDIREAQRKANRDAIAMLRAVL